MGNTNFDDPVIAVERTVFTGVNTKDYAGVIADSHLSWGQNIDLGRVGVVSGFKGFSSVAGGSVGTPRISGLKNFKRTGGIDMLVMTHGGNLRTWAGSVEGWSDPVKSDFAAGSDTLLVPGNGVLLVSNGIDNVYSFDQTDITDMGNDNVSPPKARVGAFINNRFFMANTIDCPDHFWFSNVLSTDFDRGTNVFRLNSGSGSPINGIVDMGAGEVIFLKDDEIHLLNISAASPLDWMAQRICDDDGSVSTKANVRVGNDVFYLSRKKRGITSIGKNAFDKTVGRWVALSDPLYREVMENINWAFAHTSSAVVFDNKLIFAVPVTPSTVPNYWVVFFLHNDQELNGWAVRKDPPAGVFEKYSVNGAEHLFFGHTQRSEVLKAFCTNDDDTQPMERIIEGRFEDFSQAGAKYNQKIGWFVNLEFFSIPDGGVVNAYFQTDENDWALLGMVDTAVQQTLLLGVLPLTLYSSGKICARFELDAFLQWRRCRLKLEQKQQGRNFQFLGYMIVARKQPVA